MKVQRKKILIENVKDTEKATNADIRLDSQVPAKELVSMAQQAQNDLLLTEAKVAVPLLHGLLRLRSLCVHSAVLQLTSTGFYVQVQVPVESNSAASSGISLKWQPITGIFASPLDAVNAALVVPFGRNLVEPPPPLENPTTSHPDGKEQDTQGATQTEQEQDTKQEELEDETPLAFDRSIEFKAISMTAGSLGDSISFYITAASSDKIYGKLKNEPSLTNVFSSQTGTSTDGAYQISAKMLAKINSAILSFNAISKAKQNPKLDNENKDVDEKPSDTDNLHTQEKEGVQEIQSLILDSLVGKTVKAERKYASPNSAEGNSVVGEYIGNKYSTGKGLEHGVNHRSSGKNRVVAVKPESIKAA